MASERECVLLQAERFYQTEDERAERNCQLKFLRREVIWRFSLILVAFFNIVARKLKIFGVTYIGAVV